MVSVNYALHIFIGKNWKLKLEEWGEASKVRDIWLRINGKEYAVDNVNAEVYDAIMKEMLSKTPRIRNIETILKTVKSLT